MYILRNLTFLLLSQVHRLQLVCHAFRAQLLREKRCHPPNWPRIAGMTEKIHMKVYLMSWNISGTCLAKLLRAYLQTSHSPCDSDSARIVTELS